MILFLRIIFKIQIIQILLCFFSKVIQKLLIIFKLFTINQTSHEEYRVKETMISIQKGKTIKWYP